MKRTIFSGARGENITPHRTVFSFFKHQAILIFFVMMIHSAAFSQPNKVWTQEINSAGSGRDWATFTMEDADGNIVGNGFTSFGGDVVPAIYKLDKNGTHLWTNPKWINQCGSGQYNYGQCGSMIQKKSGTTFGNYLVITKEKPCSGGVDRTAVYEIEKTTGAVVASNLNVFSALSWATSGGSGILQKPDQSGYIIIGFFATSLSGQKDIYVATLNNSLQLESRPVNLCAGNCMNGINVCTYGLSIGDDRPSSIEYIYSGGRSAEGDKTGDRLSNGGYFLGSHVGYIISGFSRNSSGNDDVYILRIKTDLCPVYEDWINSATLPSYIWARQYTTSNNCSPATLSANDIGGKVIQLPNNILLFGCHNGFEYVFDKGYAISAVFNEYRCSGDCLAGCPLGEYKEGDAALLLYKDFELYSYSCTPSHGLVKALNVAHMSGADFGFSSIYMKGVGAQKFISFGSSRDNGVIPSGSTSTHFYMLQTDLNGIRDWSKVFQGLTPNVGGCGFGLDFLDGGVSPLFDAGFIVSGNNGNNNHDAVFIRLSHTCGVDPVLTTVINPNPPHGVTWNTPRTIDGEVRIV
ncbi:MAG TPA: hypothetical protein VNJ07_03215, partial [Chitinophagales bacterium]|nr:hypothetical protein [Chitinophagales bacterium]